MFPKGLYVDVTNRTYLTTKVNSIFSLITLFSAENGEKKSEQINYLIDKSPLVARRGVEPLFSG